MITSSTTDPVIPTKNAEPAAAPKAAPSQVLAKSGKDSVSTKANPITLEWATEALIVIGVPGATATELAPKLSEVVGQEIRRKFGRSKLIKFARKAFAAALK